MVMFLGLSGSVGSQPAGIGMGGLGGTNEEEGPRIVLPQIEQSFTLVDRGRNGGGGGGPVLGHA